MPADANTPVSLQDLHEAETRIVETLKSYVDERTEQLKSYMDERTEQLKSNMDERTEQLKSYVDERSERVETRLLTSFHGWARSTEVRLRSASTTVAGFDERLALLEERVTRIEAGGLRQ